LTIRANVRCFAHQLNLPQIAHVETTNFRTKGVRMQRVTRTCLTANIAANSWRGRLLHRDRAGRLEPKFRVIWTAEVLMDAVLPYRAMATTTAGPTIVCSLPVSAVAG